MHGTTIKGDIICSSKRMLHLLDGKNLDRQIRSKVLKHNEISYVFPIRGKFIISSFALFGSGSLELVDEELNVSYSNHLTTCYNCIEKVIDNQLVIGGESKLQVIKID